MLSSSATTWLFLALLLLFACNSSRPSRPLQSRFVVSKKSPFNLSKDVKHSFGYLEVPENRSGSATNTIRLPVYIFKSRSSAPKADPVVYTVGGPGSSTMPSAQYSKYYSYLEDRDFIFFEQRGTAYAQPSLDCPEWAKAVGKSQLPGLTEAEVDRLLEAAAIGCRKRLLKENIDLDGYRTRESAADIADLVKALGIEEYNLLTLSYGTKIAQVMLRDHPQGLRSVVMDSPLPLEVSYDEESTTNLMQVLEQLLTDCASEPSCNQAFPQLKERFFAYLKEVTDRPLEVKVTNPGTGELETFRLGGESMVLIFASVSHGGVASVPMEIEKLLDGDLATVKAQLEDLFGPPGNGTGMGMRLSVWCAEEYPFVSQAEVQAEKQRFPEVRGLSPTVFDSNICQIWNVRPEPASENQAVRSDIPVLLLSGSYDSETPAKWAAGMQRQLSNSYHLVFKRWRHGITTNWSNPCGMEVARAFFNDPSTEPAIPCFEELSPQPFKVE